MNFHVVRHVHVTLQGSAQVSSRLRPGPSLESHGPMPLHPIQLPPVSGGIRLHPFSKSTQLLDVTWIPRHELPFKAPNGRTNPSHASYPSDCPFGQKLEK